MLQLIVSRDKGYPVSIQELAEHVLRDPATCGHARAGWSQDVVSYCPDCGFDMFLPPWMLALRPADELRAMYDAWRQAGRPRWNDWRLAWDCDERYWRMTSHPLFDFIGGLPVRIKN